MSTIIAIKPDTDVIWKGVCFRKSRYPSNERKTLDPVLHVIISKTCSQMKVLKLGGIFLS